MKVTICKTRASAGGAAAALGGRLLRETIESRGRANIIVATGVSQFDLVAALTKEPDIAWERVTVFHLDEYVGLPVTHAASFRAYLWNRFHRRLPRPLRAFHYVAGDEDPRAECQRLGRLIRQNPIDICFAGIGENAHLAFNDPPADFKAREPYQVVTLDQACRRQQLREGWYTKLKHVPRRAISMSVHQIMQSRTIIITAPERRKAEAVRATVKGPVTPEVPASILQRHPDTHLFLDASSAALLK